MGHDKKAIAMACLLAVAAVGAAPGSTAFAQGSAGGEPAATLAMESAGVSSDNARLSFIAENPTITFSSTPLEAAPGPAQEHIGPKQGFGISIGIGSVSGTLTLHNSPGSKNPSYGFAGIGYGMDYQWAASEKLSLGLYLRGANGISVTGDLAPGSSFLGAGNPGYDQGDSIGAGGEIRYWFGQAFVGGLLGAAMTTLTDTSGVNPDIPLSGIELGGVAGYEWPSGWQVLLSAVSRSMSGTLSTTNPATLAFKSVPVTATETRVELLGGYRL